MAKGGRKKKMQSKDFQKVKMKAGKTKPRAENFTNTTFKSQGIQIKEQLKMNDQSQPTNQRKQTITDLLNHLNHYNATIRHSSLLGIKELLTSHPVLITQNLSTLFNNLSVLLTDREQNVRKASVSVLQQVMQSVSANQMSPFFAILNAHICCAMTHIVEDIQVDSLAVLDCILQQYPELVVPHSKELLTNFVNQISQQKKSVQLKDMLGSELSINPSSTMSSQKWRIKVLQRLRQFLEVIVADGTRSVMSSGDGSMWVEGRVNHNSVSHVQMYGQSGKHPSLQEGFILRAITQDQLKTSAASSSSSYSPEELHDFMITLVPLLIQCWVEVSPRQGTYHSKMTPNALETLDGVLTVLQLLWRWMEQTGPEFIPRLQKRYLKTFNKQLLRHFPFSIDHELKKPSRAANSVAMVTINLTVCDVMSYFISGDNVDADWVKKLMSFVMETLAGHGSSMATNHVLHLLRVTRQLVKAIPVQGMVEELLEGLCILYKNCHVRSQKRRLVLEHLAQLTVLQHNDKNRNLLEFSATSQWLSSLPSFLLEVNEMDSIATALDILLQALSRRHPAALNTLQENVRSLIDSKMGLLVSTPPNLQRKAVELLHHVKQINVDVLQELALCSYDNRMHVESVTYLLQILTMSQIPPCPMFYSFLFSVNLGCSKSELEALQIQETTPAQHVASIKLSPQSVDVLPRQRALNKTVTMCYTVLESRQRMWTVLQEALLDTLCTYSIVPYTAAYAILHTCSTLGSPPNQWREDLTNKLTECCVAVLKATVGHHHTGGYDENSWEGALWIAAVDVLSQQRELWEGVCRQCCQIVTKVPKIELDSLEQFESVCMMLTRLIQSTAMRECIQNSDKGVLQTTVQTVLTHPQLSTLETRWLAEFKYETGLLLTNII